MTHATAPLHAPDDREFLTRADGWEVRVFGERDARYAYFARKQMLHLQLLHRAFGVSVLTPSKLTGDRWELHVEHAPRSRFATRAEIERVLQHVFAARLPNPVTLAGLEFWFVRIPGGTIDTIEIRAFG
jgi:hypothetical protein